MNIPLPPKHNEVFGHLAARVIVLLSCMHRGIEPPITSGAGTTVHPLLRLVPHDLRLRLRHSPQAVRGKTWYSVKQLAQLNTPRLFELITSLHHSLHNNIMQNPVNITRGVVHTLDSTNEVRLIQSVLEVVLEAICYELLKCEDGDAEGTRFIVGILESVFLCQVVVEVDYSSNFIFVTIVEIDRLESS